MSVSLMLGLFLFAPKRDYIRKIVKTSVWSFYVMQLVLSLNLETQKANIVALEVYYIHRRLLLSFFCCWDSAVYQAN